MTLRKVTTSGSNTVNIVSGFIETYPHGSRLTYSYDADAGYLHIRPMPDAFASATTEHVVPDRLLIDIDSDGYVRGIESLGGEITLADLLLVLRGCKWDPPTEATDD